MKELNTEEGIQKYQDVCLQIWEIIKSLRGVFELQALQEFLEIAFCETIMEQCTTPMTSFYKDLASDIFEVGN